MVLGLALLIFATLGVIWFGFLRNKEISKPPLSGVIYAIPRVEIDWQILEGFRAKTARPIEGISAFEGEFGRKNPFTPY